MFEIVKSESFERWLLGLKDRMARLRVQVRIDRLADGNPGDFKALRDGISELHIDRAARGSWAGVQGVFHATRPVGDCVAGRWRQVNARRRY